MNTLTITRNKIILPIIAWLFIFLALSAYNFNQLQLLNIVGYLFLMIVPGLLTLLCVKLRGLEFWGYVALTVAFSLLELMLMALLGNTFLPFAGITRPLDKFPLMLELYLLVGTLASIAWLRIGQ